MTEPVDRMGHIERDEPQKRALAIHEEWGLTPQRVVRRTRAAEAEVESLTTQLRGAVEALQRAEEDRDHWKAEAERCHESLIDAGQRLDALTQPRGQ